MAAQSIRTAKGRQWYGSNGHARRGSDVIVRARSGVRTRRSGARPRQPGREAERQLSPAAACARLATSPGAGKN
jgi:hypothetical protein